MNGTTSSPAQQILGDLTNRDQYQDAILEEMIKAVNYKPAGIFAKMIGTTGLAEVTRTEAARLQFIEGVDTTTALGGELMHLLQAERKRRQDLADEFRALLQRLHNSKVDDEKVVAAVLKYEKHQRDLRAPAGSPEQAEALRNDPRYVPPRNGLRTEERPRSAAH